MIDFAKSLGPQEQILWRGKPVKIAFFLPALGGIPFALFFWAIIFILQYLEYGRIGIGPSFFVILISAFTILLVFVFPGIQLLRLRNTEYLITNQRVIIHSGAFGKNTRLVDLERIQEPHVRVGLVDRLFGTGSIIVLTAGQIAMSPMGGDFIDTRSLHFRIIPNISAVREPYDINKLLTEAIKRIKSA